MQGDEYPNAPVYKAGSAGMPLNRELGCLGRVFESPLCKIIWDFANRLFGDKPRQDLQHSPRLSLAPHIDDDVPSRPEMSRFGITWVSRDFHVVPAHS